MTMKTFPAIAALMAAVAMPATAAPAPAAAQAARPEAARFKAEADLLVQAAYPADGPGAVLLVARGGHVVYASGRGLADVGAGRPIGPDTIFRLGSITKQFTAAVVLQLVHEGKLSLDDPISRFFPDFPQPGARATVRQLLNHVSGLQDYTKLPGWLARNRDKPQSTADLVALTASHPSTAEPGQKWEYNNGGYVMLGAIVEKVTGKPWHQEVADRIARPLGLKTITYGVTGEATPAMARGYTEEAGRQQLSTSPHMSVPGAAGGLIGSAADLARWAQALHHGRVVDPALYREMTSPARLADGSTQPYGFALRLRELRGRTAFEHGGAISGFSTASIYLPSEDLFVAVFANSDDPVTPPANLLRRAVALALGEPFPAFTRAEIDPAGFEPLAGMYRAEKGPPIRVAARDGKLIVAQGEDQLELVPAGQDRFFPADGELVWFGFVRRADGAIVLEEHSPAKADADVDRAVRTGPIPADAEVVVDPALLRSYVGIYATEMAPATVAMGEDGKLTIQLNSPPLPMRPVSQTEFIVDRARSRVIFHPENGRVDSLTIRRGARELQGKRTPAQ
jgi:D-alanyl-D-alanine carboxypeptidase